MEKVTLRVLFNDKVKYEKKHEALMYGLDMAYVTKGFKIDVPENTNVRVETVTDRYTLTHRTDYFIEEGTIEMDAQMVTAKVEQYGNAHIDMGAIFDD